MSQEHGRTKDICSLLGIPKSTYYYQKNKQSKVDPDTERLCSKSTSIHSTGRGSPGQRSIVKALQKDGEHVGRYKVRSLMKALNLRSTQHRKHKYKIAEQESKYAKNILNRKFNVDSPNKVWCGDVTFIWSGTEWLYLAIVIDLYARKIVGWACSRSPDSNLTCAALRFAYESRGRPEKVLFHSDQGCHYSSKQFRKMLSKFDMKQSMSRRGNCWDNAPTERFFRSFKVEWMPKKCYENFEAAENDVQKYIIDYYNSVRLHSYIGYEAPNIAEKKAMK